MFGIIEVLFPIAFAAVAVFIIISLVRGVKEWSHNNQQPRIPVEAQAVTKRSSTTHHHHTDPNGAGHTTHSTTYYITFEFASSDRQEFKVAGREYRMIAEGDRGTLTFQGTRFIGFDRHRPE